jgi:hypothetical protein
LIVGQQIAAEDAGLEAEQLGVSWQGMKFGERMGVRHHFRGGTVGSAMDYSFCAWAWLCVRRAAASRGKLMVDSATHRSV